MKKIIFILAIMLLFILCSSKPNSSCDALEQKVTEQAQEIEQLKSINESQARLLNSTLDTVFYHRFLLKSLYEDNTRMSQEIIILENLYNDCR